MKYLKKINENWNIFEKFSFDNPISLNKIIIPVNEYELYLFSSNINYDISIFCMAHYLKSIGKIKDAKGYISSIKSDSKNFDIYQSLKDKLDTEYIYVNIGNIQIYLKRKQIPFYFDGEKMSDFFEKFMIINYNNDDYYVCKEINEKIDLFFKYIPFIKNNIIISVRGDYSLGYCCSDCDGSYSGYREMNVDRDLYDIKTQLKKLKFKNT